MRKTSVVVRERLVAGKTVQQFAAAQFLVITSRDRRALFPRLLEHRPLLDQRHGELHDLRHPEAPNGEHALAAIMSKGRP